MASISNTGLEELMKQLSGLEDEIERISKKAINNALPILLETEKIELENVKKQGTGQLAKSLRTRKAKKSTKGKMKGKIVGSVYFKGYRQVKGKKVANGLIANSLNYGNMRGEKPTNFADKAVNKTATVVETIIDDTIRTEINKIMN